MTEHTWTEHDETDPETGAHAHWWIAKPDGADGWTLRVFQRGDAWRWLIRDLKRRDDDDMGVRGMGQAETLEGAMAEAEETFLGRSGPLVIDWRKLNPELEMEFWLGTPPDGHLLTGWLDHDGRGWGWEVVYVGNGTRNTGLADDRELARAAAVAAYGAMKAARP